jgi:hypothetical protein
VPLSGIAGRVLVTIPTARGPNAPSLRHRVSRPPTPSHRELTRRVE